MKTKVLVLIGVLIIAFAFMTVPVMAADASITGNPTAVIAVTVPVASQDIVLTLEPGQATTYLPADPSITVSSNWVGWTVTATDNSTAIKGHMSQYHSGGYEFSKYLQNAMSIATADISGKTTGSTSDLSGSSNTIATGLAAVDGQSVPFTIAQTVQYTDPVLTVGVYKILVVFTGGVP
jgi:hypothetical protein